MIRSAFVTWLVASAFITCALAFLVVYLAFAGYFQEPMLDELECERAETAASLLFLIGGHVLSRRVRWTPRCRTTTTFGESLSYRSQPEVTHLCVSASACRTRALAHVHRRTAIGVGCALAIVAIGMRAVVQSPNLGGRGCIASPLSYGGNMLFYFVLAAIAVYSHAPGALPACGTRRAA